MVYFKLYTATEDSDRAGYVGISYYRGSTSKISLVSGDIKCEDRTTLSDDIAEEITIDVDSETVVTVDGTPANIPNSDDCTAKEHNAWKDLINGGTVTRMKLYVNDEYYIGNLADSMSFAYKICESFFATILVH